MKNFDEKEKDSYCIKFQLNLNYISWNALAPFGIYPVHCKVRMVKTACGESNSIKMKPGNWFEIAI